MIIFSRYSLKSGRGFSLVEIMVALVIGMIAMIVVMQIYGASEANKRTTTGGDDAQISGALGLFGLQRDLRQAGYGIGSYNLLGCNVTLRPGIVLNTMAPVTINHPSITGLAGQDPNTDTLLIVYGNSATMPEGDNIAAEPVPPTTYTPKSPKAFKLNDRVIAAPPTRASPCNLLLDKVTVEAPADNSSSNISVATGVASVTNGSLYNLGANPMVVAYAVRNGSLTRCDYMVNDCSNNAAANWPAIAGNIVGLLAQYGRDDTSVNPTMTGIVNRYDNTVQAPPAVILDQCGWARISAVRFALLTRNTQYDKKTVTTSVPTWEGSVANNPAGSAARPFNMSGFVLSPGTWQNYRYKVYQAVVPIKAMNWIWMGGQTGC